MKFKLIQVGTLLVIVMSIVYMAQTQNGFGHSIGGTHTNLSHPPEFYVDEDGNSMGADNAFRDPRSYRDYKDSEGNGTKSASSWALRYYASSLYNGDGGVACPNTEANADDINRGRTRESQMVIGAKLNFSASAGNSSCSGRISPSLIKDLGLTTSHFNGWSGSGMVHLHIKENKDAHRVWYPSIFTFIGVCFDAEVDESYYNRYKDRRNIGIEVSSTEITEKESIDIGAEVGHGPAKLTGNWTGSSSQLRKGVYSYPYGFEFTLNAGFWNRYWQMDSQLDKYAEVTGDLGETIDPDGIYASFIGQHVCDGS